MNSKCKSKGKFKHGCMVNLCSNLFQQYSIENSYIRCEYKNHCIIDDTIKNIFIFLFIKTY
jgi:hypothetical protein